MDATPLAAASRRQARKASQTRGEAREINRTPPTMGLDIAKHIFMALGLSSQAEVIFKISKKRRHGDCRSVLREEDPVVAKGYARCRIELTAWLSTQNPQISDEAAQTFQAPGDQLDNKEKRREAHDQRINRLASGNEDKLMPDRSDPQTGEFASRGDHQRRHLIGIPLGELRDGQSTAQTPIRAEWRCAIFTRQQKLK